MAAAAAHHVRPLLAALVRAEYEPRRRRRRARGGGLRAEPLAFATELAEFRETDDFVKAQLLGARRGLLLSTREFALPAGVAQGWHAVAALLYGSANAFARRKARADELDLAATFLCRAWRRRQLRRFMLSAQAKCVFAAAARLQRWWHREYRQLQRDAQFSTLTGPERRAQRAEKRRASERRNLVRRRRAALATAVLRYLQYMSLYLWRVVRVQAHFRAVMARRASAAARRRRLDFLRALRANVLRLPALAIRWQRVVRRWYSQADLV